MSHNLCLSNPRAQEEASSFAFEGTTLKGKAAIGGALAKLPIPAGAKRRRVTTNIQASPSAGAYVVLVTGDLAVRGTTRPPRPVRC